MSRAALYRRDVKTPPDVERTISSRTEHKHLDWQDVVSGHQPRQSLWLYFKGMLPPIKDVLRLSLFCAVTVIGMTVLSKAVFKIGWDEGTSTSRDSPNTSPLVMDMCSIAAHNASLSMHFRDETKFSLVQLQHLPGYSKSSMDSVRTVGTIEVRNAEQGSGSYIHVDLQLRASDSRLISSEYLGIEMNDYSLIVKTPKRLPLEQVTDKTSELPCLYVSAVVTISSEAKLEHLGIESDTLNVVFYPGLEYAQSRVVETKTIFESTSTYSRETIIDVNSASVTGSYPLYDLLAIHTNSGSINVEVVPKNASIENVKPAVLRLNSNSGSVNAKAPTISVPNRDYQTAISTSSGSIEVGLLHGSRTTVRSNNGQVNADLYPYGHNDSRTDIEVDCTSGSIDVTLHSSISHPIAPLKKLYAYCRSGSGSLNIFYPAQWQGTVEGTVSSGSVDLDWEGLKVVKDNKEGYVKRSIEAVRGDGEGKLEFHSTSGSVLLSVESGGI